MRMLATDSRKCTSSSVNVRRSLACAPRTPKGPSSLWIGTVTPLVTECSCKSGDGRNRRSDKKSSTITGLPDSSVWPAINELSTASTLFKNVIIEREAGAVGRARCPHLGFRLQRRPEDARPDVVRSAFADNCVTEPGPIGFGPHIHPRRFVELIVARLEMTERAHVGWRWIAEREEPIEDVGAAGCGRRGFNQAIGCTNGCQERDRESRGEDAMAEPHASGEAIRAPSGTGRMARRHRGEIFSVYQRSLRLPARNALRARTTSARASSLVAASAVRCPIFLPARAVAFPYR